MRRFPLTFFGSMCFLFILTLLCILIYFLFFKEVY